MIHFTLLVIVWFLFFGSAHEGLATERVTVGSKSFTEGVILGEILSQTLEDVAINAKIEVNRRLGMGGTGILYQALSSGEVQLYAEYTGTISEAILKNPKLRSHDEILAALKPLGLTISNSLGFDNSYALAVRRKFADRFKLKKMSDLQNLPKGTRFGFSHEFSIREDGYPALKSTYTFPIEHVLVAMEHSLALEAMSKEELDVTDVYSTDAKIKSMDLVVLDDDRAIFPKYEAVILARIEFVSSHPILWKRLLELENRIDVDKMRELNAMVDEDRLSFVSVANSFLNKKAERTSRISAETSKLARRTLEHLQLVGTALLFSIFIGIPLGIVACEKQILGRGILLISGVVQTIPSLALLCFLIPLFGIGFTSALVALCLYGLLPVVMNTFTGLRTIDPILLETADALGLNRWQALMRVRIPLASRSILSGVKTSAIVGIGTATLAALIGAGGYGATILSGLATNDLSTILMGAAPAGALAVAVYGLFEFAERLLIPKGLR